MKIFDIDIWNQANELLKQHGLWNQGWRFAFSNEKHALGRCKYSQKLIVFSRYYCDSSPEQITDTLLHEIAHALCPSKKINGRWDHHGEDWKAMARKIGAKPVRCAPPTVTSTATYNYVIKCVNIACTHQPKWHRHRLRRGTQNGSCPYCHSRVEVFKLKGATSG